MFATFPDDKWNESGFRPPLCTYRLNWARRTSWGWWDDWDDTVLQTQDSKFVPWRSEAEHATSRSRRLPTILTFTRGWGRNIFCFFETAETGNRTPNSGVKGSGANHYPRTPALPDDRLNSYEFWWSVENGSHKISRDFVRASMSALSPKILHLFNLLGGCSPDWTPASSWTSKRAFPRWVRVTDPNLTLPSSGMQWCPSLKMRHPYSQSVRGSSQLPIWHNACSFIIIIKWQAGTTPRTLYWAKPHRITTLI